MLKVRQVFDTQPRGFQAEHHPLPLRAFSTDVANQLLVDQPRLDRAEVAQPRPPDARNVLRFVPFLRGRRSEMLVVYRLFQKLCFVSDLRMIRYVFFKEFPS